MLAKPKDALLVPEEGQDYGTQECRHLRPSQRVTTPSFLTGVAPQVKEV